jgi:antitoxin (DNA-binding transcriptional repressor) of toxin-antitoxin stability system
MRVRVARASGCVAGPGPNETYTTRKLHATYNPLMSDNPIRDPSEHLRLHWREALADALHHRIHREVTRNGRTSAMLVPPDWYETARQTHEAPEPREWSARVGRTDLTRVLDAVEYQGTHAVITRYSKPAALFVPPDWYREATQAPARAAEPDASADGDTRP